MATDDQQTEGEVRKGAGKMVLLRRGLGALSLLYGVYAFAVGRAYLPGLWRHDWAFTRADGRALGLTYVVIGLLLICRREWFREYVLGLGLGAASALYGLYALMSGHAFLPGLRGGTSSVTGTHGRGVALAYFIGGVYLLSRLFLQKRVHRDFYRSQLYFVQNVLLLILIAALAYVVLNVGTAG